MTGFMGVFVGSSTFFAFPIYIPLLISYIACFICYFFPGVVHRGPQRSLFTIIHRHPPSIVYSPGRGSELLMYFIMAIISCIENFAVTICLCQPPVRLNFLILRELGLLRSKKSSNDFPSIDHFCLELYICPLFSKAYSRKLREQMAVAFVENL